MSTDADALPEPADFEADTAVERVGDGWRGEVTGAWSGPPGPNGGYIAALMLRAIGAEVGDPARHPRALTIHYMRPPQQGEVEVEVTLERAGRNAATATARMRQGGNDTCLALCTLAGEFEAAAAYSEPMPSVPPPQRVEPLQEALLPPPIFRQLSYRPCFGEPPFSDADSTLVGGWMRTEVPAPLGPELIALYTDAWWPTPFPLLDGPMMAPTLDLTIHFRAVPPREPGQQVLGRFRSTTAAEGFFEEDGELWTADGTLIAQSRQLALARPLPEGFSFGE